MSKVHNSQIIDESARPKIGSEKGANGKVQSALVDNKLGRPLDVVLDGDIITLESSVKQLLESDGSGGTQNSYQRRLPLLGGAKVNPVESTFDLASGNTTGDFPASPMPNPPTVTIGNYIQMGIELQKNGQFAIVWGTENAVPANTGTPSFSTDNTVQRLIVMLHIVTGGAWDFDTPAKSDIEIFDSIQPVLPTPVGGIPIGALMPIHTFNGTIPVEAGWFRCRGEIINQTNYDLQHGAGAWASDIGSSILDGKYAPDITENTYLAGVQNTTQDGSAPITKIGSNSHGHTVDAHGHTVNSHGHTVNSHGHTIDHTHTAIVVGGSATSPKTVGVRSFSGSSGSSAPGTSAAAPGTSNESPATDSVSSNPKAIEAEFHIKIK